MNYLRKALILGSLFKIERKTNKISMIVSRVCIIKKIAKINFAKNLLKNINKRK